MSESDIYVWPYSGGIHRDQSIEPLYKTVPSIIHGDYLFYELLAITDILWVGRSREINIA